MLLLVFDDSGQSGAGLLLLVLLDLTAKADDAFTVRLEGDHEVEVSVSELGVLPSCPSFHSVAQVLEPTNIFLRESGEAGSRPFVEGIKCGGNQFLLEGHDLSSSRFVGG